MELNKTANRLLPLPVSSMTRSSRIAHQVVAFVAGVIDEIRFASEANKSTSVGGQFWLSALEISCSTNENVALCNFNLVL